jgi:hypothetical protein
MKIKLYLVVSLLFLKASLAYSNDSTCVIKCQVQFDITSAFYKCKKSIFYTLLDTSKKQKKGKLSNLNLEIQIKDSLIIFKTKKNTIDYKILSKTANSIRFEHKDQKTYFSISTCNRESLSYNLVYNKNKIQLFHVLILLGRPDLVVFDGEILASE